MNLVKKIIIILILSTASCFVFNSFLQKGLKKYSVHTNERLTTLFTKNTFYDIIFIGSSRTHTNVNPAIIDSICQVNSYNFGIEGGNLLEFYYAYKAYFEHHPPPHILVLTLDLNSFNLTRKFFNPTIYLNYTNNHIVEEMLNNNGYNTLSYKILPFLLLTEQDDYTKGNAFKGYGRLTDIPFGETSYKGFMTNTNDVLKDIDTNFKSKPSVEEMDPQAMAYLYKIIEISKENKVQLIFTYAPEFKFCLQRGYPNTQQIFDTINKIALINHIQYLRNDSLEICKDPLMFANIGHLNKKGANIYSNILAKQLRVSIKR